MPDPGIDLAEHLDREERAFLEASLAGLFRDESLSKQLKEAVDPIRARLKTYHDRHPEDVIADYERGIVASFTDRSGSASIDMISLGHHDDAGSILVALAQAGLLTCSVSALRRLAGKSDWADTTLKYLMPGSSQTVLSVERIEQ